MKNEIHVSFNYGYHSLIFKKILDLPFSPFYGLSITIDSEKEYNIVLENNDYCTTIIDWDFQKNRFFVDIRNSWKYEVSPETIDDIFKKFLSWERLDSINIEELKKLMINNNTI